ncbi:MAG TPA: AI-2E family transporter [Geobacteraceae bacterium]
MVDHQAASSRWLIGLLGMLALIAGGYAIRHTVSCFLLSFVLAYLLDPLVVLLERRRFSRLTGILLLYVGLGAFSFFFFAYLLPLINIRWASLLKNLPVYLQKGKELVGSWESGFQPAYGAEGWRWLSEKITDNLDSVLAKLGTGLYAAVSQVFFNLFNLVLAPILIFFMLFYKKQVIDGLVVWIPDRRREQVLAFGREVNASIGGYIRGQLMVSVIVAVLSYVALFFLDIDYPLLNGIFAGLSSILPFIGVILATLPPLFFAYVKFQSGVMLVKVIAAFAVIYFLEGYLIKPLVFKESMDLNPLLTIIVVMAFGELLGFWGILLAIPLAAALKIFSGHWRRGDFAREG